MIEKRYPRNIISLHLRKKKNGGKLARPFVFLRATNGAATVNTWNNKKSARQQPFNNIFHLSKPLKHEDDRLIMPPLITFDGERILDLEQQPVNSRLYTRERFAIKNTTNVREGCSGDDDDEMSSR
jgi:hypothetical protein